MPNKTTRVAIIGIGGIGSALATLFAHHDLDVILGARKREAAAPVAGDLGLAPPVTYRDAAAASDLLCLCVPWEHCADALDRLGDLAGKTIVDVSNPEGPDGRGLAIGHSISGAEMLASRAPGARVVKAFNYVYAELLRDFDALARLNPSIFLCGDHDEANAEVAALIRACSLEPIDCGPLRNARYLEPLAMLMVQLVRERNWPPAAIAMKLAHLQPPGLAVRPRDVA